MSTKQLSELEVLKCHYAKLCNTMDIESLRHHFIERNIIQPYEFNEMATPRRKVEKLLQYINSSLQAENTSSFYTMLSIMEEHGSSDTKQLASKMRHLTTTSHRNRSCCTLTIDKAFLIFHDILVKTLPMDDSVFIAKLNSLDLLSDDKMDQVVSKVTRQDRAAYFLSFMKQTTRDFDELVEVMEDSEHHGVKQLARLIRAKLVKGAGINDTGLLLCL